MSFPAFLYAMEDPREPGHIRYIGQTRSLPQRWTTHTQRAARPNTLCGDAPLYDWWRTLSAVGVTPLMRVFWQGESGAADEMEQRAIAAYKRLGFDLFNVANGGAGNPGFRPSKETRRKLSAASRGKSKSADTKARMRASWTSERRARVSARRIGRKLDAVTRANMKVSWTVARRAKQSELLKARHLRSRVLKHSKVFYSNEL